MTLSFTNNKRYIFIVRRLGKQSKLILSRLDSISNLKLNLRIHGQCGPNAHAGADLHVFLIFCFKPTLLSAHKLTLLIYGDNNITFGEGNTQRTELITFDVVDITYPYNAIFGRNTIMIAMSSKDPSI